MSRVTELEKALTTLFRKGTEVGYTETEIDEFLENIDYHALLQAVWNKAETVYAYRADGKNAQHLVRSAAPRVFAFSFKPDIYAKLRPRHAHAHFSRCRAAHKGAKPRHARGHDPLPG